MVAKKPANTASDNLLLLLALVPFVLDRKEVSVAEAAAQFGRGEDEIIRAVELIACAGVPGDSTAYSHLDLFDIDWDLFENDRRITFGTRSALTTNPGFPPAKPLLCWLDCSICPTIRPIPPAAMSQT